MVSDMALKLLITDHEVSQSVETLNAKVLCVDYGKLWEDWEDDVAELDMAIDEQLCILHDLVYGFIYIMLMLLPLGFNLWLESELLLKGF